MATYDIAGDVDRIVGDATSTVIDRFSQVVPMATSAYNATITALTSLGAALQAIHMNSVDITYEPPDDTPTFSQLEAYIPDIDALSNEIEGILAELDALAKPEDPTFEDIDTPSYPDRPNFDKDSPTYIPPALPSEFTDTPPDSFTDTPPDKVELTFPADPTEFTGTKPTMEAITPPSQITPPATFGVTAPTPTMPAEPQDISVNEIIFSGTPIDFSQLTWNPPPNAVLHDSDGVEFAGTYTNNLMTILVNIATNGGAMGEDVQNASMELEQERAQKEHDDSINRAINEWAARGFDIPSGDIQGKVLVLETTYRDKRLDLSRTIMIENFKLNFQNMQYAIGEWNKHESASMEFATSFFNRYLDCQKANSQLMIQVLEAEIKRFNLKLDYHKTQLTEWETRNKIELSKVDIYKARLQMFLGKVDVEKSKVDIYKAQVGAYDALLNAYKSQVQAYVAQYEIERMKIEKFKAEIEAYNADVLLKKSEYELYIAKTTGQEAKVKIFQAQVDAYRGQVEAYKSKIDAYNGRINAKVGEYTMYRAQVEGAKAPIEVFTAEAQAYKSEVDGYLGNISAETAKMELPVKYNDAVGKKYETLMKGYGLQVETGIKRVESNLKALDTKKGIFDTIGKTYEALGSLNIKSYDSAIQKAYYEAQLKLKQAEIEIANYEKLTAVIIEGSKGAAAVAAQLCVGLSSSVSAQAHISGQGSASESFNYSETHSWDETED